MVDLKWLEKQRALLIEKMRTYPTIDMHYLFMQEELALYNRRIRELKHGEDKENCNGI